jgi:hypothetical protein
MIDVLICSVPSGIINRPPAAPALLRACLEQHGYSANTVDFSLLLYTELCNSDYNVYDCVNRQFESYTVWKNDPKITAWLDLCIKEISLLSPKFLAISVFSYFQHRATVLLCEAVRQSFPTIKIILGGYGLPESYLITFKNFRSVSAADKLSKFSDYMQRHHLVDHLIIGEGEQQIVNVLSGNQLCQDPVKLNDLPVSNFDNYKLTHYLWHSEPVLTITGSKGCVRSCTFCNVPVKFGRYRQKTGAKVASEMIELSCRYDIYKFEFTDSLVNGSQKDFLEFVKTLAQYNQTAKRPITWYGQYICRPQSQVPQGIYQLMKQSGAVHLIIGAESGSNAVLQSMNKKITAEDVFNELDQFERHGLQAQLLMLVGFYSEDAEKFLENLKFIVRCHRYLAAGVISRVSVGLPLIIEPNGYLHIHASELGIIVDESNNNNWKVACNPDNTWLERIRRKVIMQSLLRLMKVSMTGNGISELRFIVEQLKLYEQQLRSLDTAIDSSLLRAGSH